MLVDINLLPKKERKRFGFIIPIALLFILIMLVAVYYYYQISSIKTNIDSADKQISTVRRITAQESEKMNKTQSTDSVTQLKNGIEWADSYRIQSVPVMRELTSLLPERGFIQSFKYEESGMVTLTAQFDTPSEAAYYLNSLNHSKWIEEATLTSLNANTENSSESSTGQSNSSNTPDYSSQNNSPDTTTQNNLNSGAISNGSTSNTNADYLPRYTGQFDIKLNKAMVRKIITETNKDGKIEEGVTAP
jgi:Tfp pilus assembly protein PilN